MDDRDYSRSIGGPTAAERDEITRNAVEVAKAAKAEELARLQQRAKPSPRPDYANDPRAHDAAFPPQVITKIRDSYEPVREFVTESPDQLRVTNQARTLDEHGRMLAILWSWYEKQKDK